MLDRVGSVIMTGLYSLFLRPLIGRRKIVGRDRPQKLSVERSTCCEIDDVQGSSVEFASKKRQTLARQRIRILSRGLIKGVAGGINQTGLKRCFDAAAGFMEMAAVEKATADGVFGDVRHGAENV